MGRIDLRPRLTGHGYVGTVDVESPGSGPTLSWADSQALQSLAASSQSISASVDTQTAAVAYALGWVGAEISGAIADLERELGLRLAEQTEVLGRQLEALERIDAALRHPAKVRAAERLVDAGKLLDQRRFDRALPLAEEAISDDPLNPAAFGAAAWALLGLGRLEESHDHFAEAAVAAEGPEKASYTRRQARVAFALERAEDAEEAVRKLVTDDSVAASERAACSYDLAIYAAPHNLDEAVERLRQATSYDSRYAVWALADPLIHEHPALLDVALSQLESFREQIETATVELHEVIRTAEERLAAPIDLALSTREELADVLAEAKAFTGQAGSNEPLAAHLIGLDRKAPLQRQLIIVNQVTGRVTRALAQLDDQMQAVPRIRELMAEVQRLTDDLAARKEELDRLDKETYEEYIAAASYTQNLTNALYKYRGRKYDKKLRERDEASARHMALSEEHSKIRPRAIGREPDPESGRIAAELARARTELLKLNPAVRRLPTSPVQPPSLPPLEEQAQSEMDAAFAERASNA